MPTSLPDRFRGWFGTPLGDMGDWGAGAGVAGIALGAGDALVGDVAGGAARTVGAGADRVGNAAGDATQASEPD